MLLPALTAQHACVHACPVLRTAGAVLLASRPQLLALQRPSCAYGIAYRRTRHPLRALPGTRYLLCQLTSVGQPLANGQTTELVLQPCSHLEHKYAQIVVYRAARDGVEDLNHEAVQVVGCIVVDLQRLVRRQALLPGQPRGPRVAYSREEVVVPVVKIQMRYGLAGLELLAVGGRSASVLHACGGHSV